jgi:hypothetical protein
MFTRPVLINLLLFVITSVLFIAFSFAFGYASNPIRYSVQLVTLYIALVFVHLFLNYYWFRKILSFGSMVVLSGLIGLIHIFLYRFIAG